MRVIGLDISKEHVACVELESAFGRFEIRETQEMLIPPETDPASYAPSAIASQLLSNLNHRPDRLVTALPIEITTFRNLQVATKDKKAIKAALEFELEDDLPFDKDSLHYDSIIMDSGPSGSLIHIGATKKESFESHLDVMQGNGIDPDVITTEAWAYRSLFTRLKNMPESVLLLGFERTKTFFYVHSKNRPVLYREIPFGLKTIERKLQEDLSGSESELRSWINDIGVTGIDERVSDAIADVLELLVPELKQSELAARSQIKSAISQIYVTGDGALMPGFLNWLESAAFMPVSLFKPLSLLSPAAISYSDVTEIRFARALALAMTILPADKLQPINLRRGDFSKTDADQNSVIELIKKPLPYLVVTSLVFFATKTIEYNYYKNKLTDTEDSLKRAVKTYYGGISDSAARTYLADTEKLKRNIEKDVAKERELSKLFAPNPNSPLDFLKNLSQKIGKDIVLDMVSFDAGAENTDRFVENKPLKATLTFLISNPQLLARLTETVEKNFNLKRGNSEEVTQEGRKVYRVLFSGTLGAAK